MANKQEAARWVDSLARLVRQAIDEGRADLAAFHAEQLAHSARVFARS